MQLFSLIICLAVYRSLTSRMETIGMESLRTMGSRGRSPLLSPGQNCFIKMVFCPNFRVGHVDVALEKWAPITLKIFNKYDWLCLLLFHFSSFLFSSSTLCFFGFHSFLQSLLLCCMWFSPFLRFCAWFSRLKDHRGPLS